MARNVVSLDDVRLAKRLGVLDSLISQRLCSHCRWPINGVVHQDVCVRVKKAKRAAPAPTQPWEPKQQHAA